MYMYMYGNIIAIYVVATLPNQSMQKHEHCIIHLKFQALYPMALTMSKKQAPKITPKPPKTMPNPQKDHVLNNHLLN